MKWSELEKQTDLMKIKIRRLGSSSVPFVAIGLLSAGLSLSLDTKVFAQQTIYVKVDAVGLNNGASWTDAFISLQDALAAAGSGDEVWVAAGAYHPDLGGEASPGDRNASFVLRPGVRLFGGFTGNETILGERDWQANETILSGDLAGDDSDNTAIDEPSRSENSYHVVTAESEVDSTTVLDGFVISGGQADGTGSMSSTTGLGGGLKNSGDLTIQNIILSRNAAGSGGGISNAGNVVLTNVTFFDNFSTAPGGGIDNSFAGAMLSGVSFQGNVSENFGGGMYNNRSEVVIFDAQFLANQADWGGGMYNRLGSQTLINTVFLGNRATRFDGGGILNDESETELANVLFSGNTAEGDGGGIYNVFPDAGSFTATNLTLSRNWAKGEGGGMWNWYGSPILSNSIIWGNSASNGTDQVYNRPTSVGPTTLSLSHSLIEGGLPPDTEDGGGNRFDDPLFVDAAGRDGIPGTEDDDLHLQAGSPAIGAGDNIALPADTLDLDGDGNTLDVLPVDLDGHVRVFDADGDGPAIVDMGAYEFGAPPVTVAIESEESGDAPATMSRLEVFPNPSPGLMTLNFMVRNTVPIHIALYDLTGRRVRWLFDGTPAGGQMHSISVDGRNLAEGVYFFRLIGEGVNATATLALIR